MTRPSQQIDPCTCGSTLFTSCFAYRTFSPALHPHPPRRQHPVKPLTGSVSLRLTRCPLPGSAPRRTQTCRADRLVPLHRRAPRHPDADFGSSLERSTPPACRRPRVARPVRGSNLSMQTAPMPTTRPPQMPLPAGRGERYCVLVFALAAHLTPLFSGQRCRERSLSKRHRAKCSAKLDPAAATVSPSRHSSL